MVQFKQHSSEPPCGCRRARQYWKLDTTLSAAQARRYLDLKGVVYKKTSSRSRLDVLHTRVQRGLPVYDKDTLHGLHAHYLQRCSRSPVLVPHSTLMKRFHEPAVSSSAASRAARRSNLISYLERYDEEAGFGRLMDLPPELRIQIFEHYFKDVMADVGENYAGFLTQPPITRVSKIMRQESLHVFLKCCTMSILFVQDVRGPNPMDSRFITGASTTDFLKKAPIECLQAVRKPRLRGWLDVSSSSLRWQVKLDTPAVQVEWPDAHRQMQAMSNSKDRIAAFESRLREMVAARRDQNGRFVLQSGDEVALPAMLDDYLRE